MGKTPEAIHNRLKHVEPAQVLIKVGAALGDLVKEGKVVPGSRVDLARSKIGMAVRAGTPKPDIGTVEAFKRAGPKPTRESWIAAVESLKDFQTGIFADTETFSKDNHVGVRKMFAVGLNDAGEETVYTAFGKPLPSGS